MGRNSLAIEWVEHRHWMFSAEVGGRPAPSGERLFFCADSLDYSGWILIDGQVVGEFAGPLHPTRIDVTSAWADKGSHTLAIVFDQPPEAQGQLGYTSRTQFFKPRYNFSWDWCPRVVPIGAAGELAIRVGSQHAVSIAGVQARLSEDLQKGTVEVHVECDDRLLAHRPAEISCVLRLKEAAVAEASALAAPGRHSIQLAIAAPALWWPAGCGEQTLYQLAITVVSEGRVLATHDRTIGFKHVAWQPCEGAAADALPWICVVNQRPLFLQGVNWTPVRLCYQDTTPAEYGQRVALYQEIGCNLLRVWGGGLLESPEFYAHCDRAGLLVWQEFPLSSSGVDSFPPTEPDVIAELVRLAGHYIAARQHHACLLLWCGGNELLAGAANDGTGSRVPCLPSHPCLAALDEVVRVRDPGRRFLPTSPFGPRFGSNAAEFGLGLHHEVHGPWGLDAFPTRASWESYWINDDSLFRGEVGVPGASDVELIRQFAGNEPVWPPTTPLWFHSSGWWTQWERLQPLFAGHDDDEALARYCEHTQHEQAQTLAFAASATKARFPRAGGFIVWMGHDCFPCLANTSIIDFGGQLKPAALALQKVFLQSPEKLRTLSLPTAQHAKNLVP